VLITTSGAAHSSVALELDPGEGEPDPIKAAVAIPALNPFDLAVVKLLYFSPSCTVPKFCIKQKQGVLLLHKLKHLITYSSSITH
jgi:hypothetical protein